MGWPSRNAPATAKTLIRTLPSHGGMIMQTKLRACWPSNLEQACTNGGSKEKTTTTFFSEG